MNIIGLDISQHTVDGYLIYSKGTRYLKANNNVDGFEQIKSLIKQNRLRNLAVCMEATGNYHENIANYLSKHYPVYVINPLQIKNYSKSLLQRNKTDKADAKLIAEYGLLHLNKLQQYIPPTVEQQQLQRWLALQYQLKKQLTQTKNRLYASQDNFVREVHQNIIMLLQTKLAEIAQKIYSLIKKQSYLWQHYKNLLTIPGIGKETASLFLNYLDQRKFQSANQFIAFVGLSPDTQQSGTSVKRTLGSGRYSNRRLKSAFFMPALVAYRLGVFGQLVKNLERRKKPKMVILGAIMRKLAKIAFYLYKTNQAFDKTRYQTVD